MMQQQMPMGPPMGGMMGPPMGQAPQMPQGPQSIQPQAQQGQQVTGDGGSTRGRAGFKAYMRQRRSETEGRMTYPQASMQPMGALPPPPIPQFAMQQGPMVGRRLPSGSMVGSAPVQMMGGGAVPLFRGLGYY